MLESLAMVSKDLNTTNVCKPYIYNLAIEMKATLYQTQSLKPKLIYGKLF